MLIFKCGFQKDCTVKLDTNYKQRIRFWFPMTCLNHYALIIPRKMVQIFSAKKNSRPNGKELLLDGIPIDPCTTFCDTTPSWLRLTDLDYIVPRSTLYCTLTFKLSTYEFSNVLWWRWFLLQVWIFPTVVMILQWVILQYTRNYQRDNKRFFHNYLLNKNSQIICLMIK